VIVRRILFIVSAIVLAVAILPRGVAAQPDPTPSPADLEAAKKAFLAGKKAFEAKKYGEAVAKFKESYRLSKKPTLLYNIAVSLDENQQKDMALFYYRKFLSDAPADDAQRPTATTRTKALEQDLGVDAGKSDGETTPPPDKTPPDKTPPEVGKKPPEVKKPPKIKPPGTYTAADFQHAQVEEAPPGKPLDLTASVPEDSGFVVTVFYRGANDAQFTPVQMKWRYRELVGRIPAAKMAGTSVQYYVEVKEANGTVVTKIAKAASPNVVYLEPSAPARFYPDWNQESGGGAATNDGGSSEGNGSGKPSTAPVDNEDPLAADTSDDPLKPGGKQVAIVTSPNDPTGGAGGGSGGGGDGAGFMDVGSSKFRYTKWGTTAVAGAMVGLAVFSYIRASQFSNTLEGEADLSATECGTPPCRPWDEFLRDSEASGKRYQTMFRVGLGVGLVAGGIAGYYWIKELRAGGKVEKKPDGNAANRRGRRWLAVPAVGDGVVGGAAAVEF
jgi:hypothetical protein